MLAVFIVLTAFSCRCLFVFDYFFVLLLPSGNTALRLYLKVCPTLVAFDVARKVSLGCVCAIKAMNTHITLQSTECSCPEFSFLLGDKLISQPALFQTLVGHSVIVVRRVCVCLCSLVSNFISRHLWGLPPRRCR